MSQNLTLIGLTFSVFLVLLVLWCTIGYIPNNHVGKQTRRNRVGKHRKNGEYYH